MTRLSHNKTNRHTEIVAHNLHDNNCNYNTVIYKHSCAHHVRASKIHTDRLKLDLWFLFGPTNESRPTIESIQFKLLNFQWKSRPDKSRRNKKKRLGAYRFHSRYLTCSLVKKTARHHLERAALGTAAHRTFSTKTIETKPGKSNEKKTSFGEAIH